MAYSRLIPTFDPQTEAGLSKTTSRPRTRPTYTTNVPKKKTSITGEDAKRANDAYNRGTWDTLIPKKTSSGSTSSGGGSGGGGSFSGGGGSGSGSGGAGVPTKSTIAVEPKRSWEDILQEAKDLADLRWNPAEDALKTELERLISDRDLAINTSEGFGDVYDERLAAIAAELDNLLGESTGRIGGYYDTAQENIGGYYDSATENVAGSQQSAIDNILSEMGLLGLTGGEKPIGEIGELGTELQGLLQTGKADTLSRLEMGQADSMALSEQGRADAGREWAGNRENLANQVVTGINEIYRQAEEAQQGVNNQLATIAEQRGLDIKTTAKELEREALDRHRQSKLDALAEEIQRNTMNLQNKQFGLSQDQFNFEKQMTLQQYQDQQAQLQAEIEASNDPLERAMKQAQLDKLIAETDNIYHNIANPNTGGSRASDGLSAVQQKYGGQIANTFENLYIEGIMQIPDFGISPEQQFPQLIRMKVEEGEITPSEAAVLNNAFLVFQGKG